MYIQTGGASYPCRNYYPGDDSVRFALEGEVLPAKLGADVSLHQDDGLELCRHKVSAFKRWEISGAMLTLTNLPVPVPMPPAPPTKEELVAALKCQLEATDYRIIKCSEYSLAGEKALPYDIATLHKERKGIRDEINELEGAV